MVDTRTVTLPAIWADDAITEIPTPPIANTTYRNTDLGSTELLQGWPYQKIVDSADFNQTLWLISNLVKSCEQYGIMPWCASTTYKQNGICLASNGIFYLAKKDNTGVNPVTDSGMTNWGVFLDPGDNFVTETVLTSQINLCEKLANKTQSLSSSSTTTQYPSAKAVYDNITNAKADLQAQITSNDTDITNLKNNKQNNITGGASTITTSNLTTNRALVSDGSGKVAVSAVTNTELGYLDGVTSNIQTQLNGKQASGSYMALSGNQTASGNKTFSGQIILSTAPSASDNSTQVPNTSWVNSRITSIMNSVGQGYTSQKGDDYIKFSNGLIVQWGTSTSSSRTITFEISFTQSPAINITPNSVSGYNFAAAVDNFSTTGFTIQTHGGVSSSPHFWIAIGY